MRTRFAFPPISLAFVFTLAGFALSAGGFARPAQNNWTQHANQLRVQIREVLTFPEERTALDPKTHRRRESPGYAIESVSYQSEPGSRVTALLYLPTQRRVRPVPAIVMGAGHGGSKSALSYQYAGQLYASMGFACLVPDTIGEEERHKRGEMGTRAHDMYEFVTPWLDSKDTLTRQARRAFTRERLKRMVMGKLVWDLSRGIDFLQEREEIDPKRIGVAGSSLGGATTSALTLVDERVKAAVISGWAMTTAQVIKGKECTRMPYEAFSQIMDFTEMHALLAPHAAVLFINGDSDWVIDRDEHGQGIVRRVRACVAGARQILEDAGIEATLQAEFIADGGHRPYFLTASAVRWLQAHLMLPQERKPLPEQRKRYGDWVAAQGHEIEKLYNTELHKAGAIVVDIDAVAYAPRELACFPERSLPLDDYTWDSWVKAQLAKNEASDESPPSAFDLTRRVP